MGLIITIVNILSMSIMVDVILSWLPEARGSRWAEPFVKISGKMCDPIRRVLPQMPIDLSPIIVILILNFLGSALMGM